MGKKLTCTIESRMPLADRYDVIPEDTSVANDYPTLNKYCDEVRVMAYDQARIDLRLNASKSKDALYAPVADVAWVRKVLDRTVKEVARNKIILGIPTYGYEYEINQGNSVGSASTTYKIVRSRTYKQAMDLAASVGASTQRNSAGELSFTYTATSSPFSTSSSSARFLSVSDVEAAKDKIALAKEYKLGGVVFFKIDGEADPKIWDLMSNK
jgi:spore germination protein YaaH